jgi:hypothetical protein
LLDIFQTTNTRTVVPCPPRKRYSKTNGNHGSRLTNMMEGWLLDKYHQLWGGQEGGKQANITIVLTLWQGARQRPDSRFRLFHPNNIKLLMVQNGRR